MNFVHYQITFLFHSGVPSLQRRSASASVRVSKDPLPGSFENIFWNIGPNHTRTSIESCIDRHMCVGAFATCSFSAVPSTCSYWRLQLWWILLKLNLHIHFEIRCWVSKGKTAFSVQVCHVFICHICWAIRCGWCHSQSHRTFASVSPNNFCSTFHSVGTNVPGCGAHTQLLHAQLSQHLPQAGSCCGRSGYMCYVVICDLQPLMVMISVRPLRPFLLLLLLFFLIAGLVSINSKDINDTKRAWLVSRAIAWNTEIIIILCEKGEHSLERASIMVAR